MTNMVNFSLYCIYSAGRGEVFWLYLAKPERVWMGIYVRGEGAHSHEKLGEITLGVPPKDAKMCFFSRQYNADFRPLILH